MMTNVRGDFGDDFTPRGDLAAVSAVPRRNAMLHQSWREIHQSQMFFIVERKRPHGRPARTEYGSNASPVSCPQSNLQPCEESRYAQPNSLSARPAFHILVM